MHHRSPIRTRLSLAATDASRVSRAGRLMPSSLARDERSPSVTPLETLRTRFSHRSAHAHAHAFTPPIPAAIRSRASPRKAPILHLSDQPDWRAPARRATRAPVARRAPRAAHASLDVLRGDLARRRDASARATRRKLVRSAGGRCAGEHRARLLRRSRARLCVHRARRGARGRDDACERRVARDWGGDWDDDGALASRARTRGSDAGGRQGRSSGVVVGGSKGHGRGVGTEFTRSA